MNYQKIKKRMPAGFLLITLMLSYISHAQIFLPEVNVAPNPLDKIKSSFYPIPQKPVRSITYIVAGDTTSISSFDSDGNENLNIGYSKNKPVNKLVYKNTGTATEVLLYGNFQKELQPTSKYRYDKSRNIVEWERIGESAIHWYFEYDNKNRLKRKYTMGEIVANQKARMQEYIYDSAGRLTEIVREQWVMKFEYDGGHLISQKEFYINGDINTLSGSSRYSYNDAGQLIMMVNKFDSVQYFYEGTSLKNMISYKNDSTYEAVAFFYDKNRLQKVEIATTTIYTGTLFIFPSLAGTPGKGQVVNKTMEFFYDSKNNIKEIKYFLEGEYKNSKSFINQYY